MKKIRFPDLFTLGVFKFKHAFDAFDASLGKLFGYFLFLNLLMFLPITSQVIGMNDLDYGFWGMNFHEEVPEFIGEDFPESCRIYNNQLDCGMSNIFEYEFMNNDSIWTVYFNVPDDVVYDQEHTIVFYRSGITLSTSTSREFILDYDYFNNTDFGDINDLEDREAYDLLINKMFLSLKDVFTLPAILFITAALFLTNLILILTISAISMLFKFNQSNFPCYKNMVKLMILASTIPSVINVILGFNGLIAFTTIVYNIITPILAFFMYRASRLYLEIKE